jgi:hypothetical protein
MKYLQLITACLALMLTSLLLLKVDVYAAHDISGWFYNDYGHRFYFDSGTVTIEYEGEISDYSYTIDGANIYVDYPDFMLEIYIAEESLLCPNNWESGDRFGNYLYKESTAVSLDVSHRDLSSGIEFDYPSDFILAEDGLTSDSKEIAAVTKGDLCHIIFFDVDSQYDTAPESDAEFLASLMTDFVMNHFEEVCGEMMIYYDDYHIVPPAEYASFIPETLLNDTSHGGMTGHTDYPFQHLNMAGNDKPYYTFGELTDAGNGKILFTVYIRNKNVIEYDDTMLGILASVRNTSDAVTQSKLSPNKSQDIKVMVNGTLLEFDQPPFIENNRTLVPMAVIFEALGAEVYWDAEAQMAMALKGETLITLVIGSNLLYKNDDVIQLDVAVKIVGGRTMIPVGAVAESLGATVSWDGNTRTVIITD